MEEAWCGALGLSIDQVGWVVYMPGNAEYRIGRHASSGWLDLLPELVFRASYLCNCYTKSPGASAQADYES
ncbi:hypothetical protein C7A17_26255 [Ectopseudomonas mendocina]|uniref:YagK/YfjJ C-terminal domain-containing protein n=2 Tax=Ectopseudomonas mendocina TaxID=300 RepID=A0A2R3QWH0_ECTME|nr:hypothetical protein C7A17_26255 [Pseudomonas mendocina]